MKNFLIGIVIVLGLYAFSDGSKEKPADNKCGFNKDSMIVVMRFEKKVLPQYVSLLKKSFDACKVQVLVKEPRCLDYSLFQSYNDSTLFCINETWATKGAHNDHMKMEHFKKHIAEIRGIDDPSFKSKTNYTYWICPGANKSEK
ncbi:MAG: antibiotic biosynthesis monooxygenase [Mariniphaga sp.]|nr:antibiotic biosynthesis monooxygenase [Mariniphaga sp.]